MRLSPAFVSGGTISLTVTGRLALNGVTHAVTVIVSARRDEAGSFGSLTDHGVAEFLLTLRRL